MPTMMSSRHACLKADFKYDRETEKYLKDLEKLAKFEGYYDDAKPEFEALKKKLSHNVAKDLDYQQGLYQAAFGK